jgi:hypothetical protein
MGVPRIGPVCLVLYALFQADVCSLHGIGGPRTGPLCLVLYALFQADVCSQLLVDQGLDQCV